MAQATARQLEGLAFLREIREGACTRGRLAKNRSDAYGAHFDKVREATGDTANFGQRGGRGGRGIKRASKLRYSSAR
jgi:hypothetical protein